MASINVTCALSPFGTPPPRSIQRDRGALRRWHGRERLPFLGSVPTLVAGASEGSTPRFSRCASSGHREAPLEGAQRRCDVGGGSRVGRITTTLSLIRLAVARGQLCAGRRTRRQAPTSHAVGARRVGRTSSRQRPSPCGDTSGSTNTPRAVAQGHWDIEQIEKRRLRRRGR